MTDEDLTQYEADEDDFDEMPEDAAVPVSEVAAPPPFPVGVPQDPEVKE